MPMSVAETAESVTVQIVPEKRMSEAMQDYFSWILNGNNLDAEIGGCRGTLQIPASNRRFHFDIRCPSKTPARKSTGTKQLCTLPTGTLTSAPGSGLPL
mmetsp:Transcript_43895/g.117197  ORF Transcript_43895/g.117197 Transcript_43895/m.117197 type:complete len:99 (+) Transcript_43895:1468-1764(+)